MRETGFSDQQRFSLVSFLLLLYNIRVIHNASTLPLVSVRVGHAKAYGLGLPTPRVAISDQQLKQGVIRSNQFMPDDFARF